MDTVITEVLGAPADDLPILKAAKMRGLAGADLDNIKLLGEELDPLRVRDFDFPPLVSLNFADRLPYFIAKPLSKALTSRPQVKSSVCTLCNVCVEVCPAEVMEKTDRININYDSCIRCYCCQEMCPHGAISSRDGWIKWIVPGL
jgi:ferredoxin